MHLGDERQDDDRGDDGVDPRAGRDRGSSTTAPGRTWRAASPRRCSRRHGRGGGIDGELGLFEVDEFWLDRLAPELCPRAMLLANLFRDQLDRYGELETIADRWAAVVARAPPDTGLILNADDPLIADLGRRSRGGTTYFGVEDPLGRAPGDAARLGFQALPQLRRAPYVYDADLPRPSRPLPLPVVWPAAPRAGRSRPRASCCTGRAARVHAAHPRRRAAPSSCRCPGLYNVYNALGGGGADASRSGSRWTTSPPGCARSRRRVRPRRDDLVSATPRSRMLLIKNPAGANEVLRTLALEDGELDLLAVLNDRTADGRDVSWVWDADFELLAGPRRTAGLRGHARGRAGAAAEVRRRPADRLRIVPSRLAPASTPRSGRRGRRGCSRCPPTPRCWSCARSSRGADTCPSSGSRRAGVSAVSTVIWHDLECGGYREDLALWRRLAADHGDPVLDVGAGTGTGRPRARPRRARGHRARPRRRAARRARARAQAERLELEIAAGRRPRVRPGRTLRALIVVPMQTIQLLGGAAGRGRVPRRRAGRTCAPGGALAVAIAEHARAVRARPDGSLPRSPTSVELDGVLYCSQPTAVRATARRLRARAPARDRRSRTAGTRSAIDPIAPRPRSPPASSSARRPTPGLRRAGRAAIAGHRRIRRQRGGDPPCLTGRTLRVCALYPDLMNIYADRGNLLLLERRCRWRGIEFSLSASGLGDALDPDGADLYYIGGGQDRDQRLCALDLAEVKRDALHAVAARGGGHPGGLRRLPAARSLLPARRRRRSPASGSSTSTRCGPTGPRLIGNVAIEVELEAGDAAGAGRLREPRRPNPPRPGSRPLGRVLKGHGNNGRDGLEGVRAGNVIGTYLHGPLLPKNAWFADWLIGTALPARAAGAAGRRARDRRPRRRPARRGHLGSPRSAATIGRVLVRMFMSSPGHGPRSSPGRADSRPRSRQRMWRRPPAGSPPSTRHHGRRPTGASGHRPPAGDDRRQELHRAVRARGALPAGSAGAGVRRRAEPQHRPDRGLDPGAAEREASICTPSTSTTGTRPSPATADGSHSPSRRYARRAALRARARTRAALARRRSATPTRSP